MIRAFLLALALLLTPGMAVARDLRVMTFNVRLPIASDGPNEWANRRDLFAATVAKADPDIIGTQELFQRQGDDVIRRLPRYAWFGRDRRGGHGDEHMGILYRVDRLRLLASGDFWLSDTPDTVASITWGNVLPRMVTWGRFRDRAGRRFVLLNTHFPYRDQDEAAREKAARLIAARLPAIAGTDPVVLTGDFNTTPDSRAHATLAATLTDVWTAAPGRTGPAETFHDFTGKPDRRIDWIFVRGFTVRGATTLTDHAGDRYPSDHFPVVADLGWASAKR
ncbi:endonuclease/exonuclease/phosphatase family protein [Sphingomonas mollis]|nr:endonuclease/exonuclease/phosphatase family protein [Sphingomonas sp. BT553]